MGLFDFLGDVSTVAAPGLEAYGKGRLAEATTVATLRNQFIDDLVQRAKLNFTRERNIEQRRQFGVTTAATEKHREAVLGAREQRRKDLLAQNAIRNLLKAEEIKTLGGEVPDFGAVLADENRQGQGLNLNLPPSTTLPPSVAIPPSRPGFFGRINEATPGPTLRDVTSWIQSRLTPKYETQAPVTSKQTIQALRESIMARGGTKEDVGNIFRVVSRKKNGFNLVAELLNKGVPISEILSAREFRTAHHNR